MSLQVSVSCNTRCEKVFVALSLQDHVGESRGCCEAGLLVWYIVEHKKLINITV